MPDEFTGPRAPIQLERVRHWRRAMLKVSHEEMQHLHFVQCMLRALGESPYLGLPPRNAAGHWEIASWRASESAAEPKHAVVVPLAPLTSRQALRFVLFESSDSLQEAGLAQLDDLFAQLADLETALGVEASLMDLPATAPETHKLRYRLTHVYTRWPHHELQQAASSASLLDAMAKDDGSASLQFQSQHDFYHNMILPLYEQAFHYGWVRDDLRELKNELQDIHYAQEGFLPVWPMYRDRQQRAQAAKNERDPMTHRRHIRDVIEEIVSEGEGIKQFIPAAKDLLETLRKVGARTYQAAVLQEARDPAFNAPQWLIDGQRLRGSHLYRFVIMMMQLRQESSLSLDFVPSRIPVPVPGSLIGSVAVAYFNSVFLVMLSWLKQVYLASDSVRQRDARHAVEMLATWPLMSVGIRPFLELLSFLPHNAAHVFRTSEAAMPNDRPHARLLARLVHDGGVTEKHRDRINYLALRCLEDVAAWAEDAAAAHPTLPPGALRRLHGLVELREFRRQFAFRAAGGYADRAPSLTYRQTHNTHAAARSIAAEDATTPGLWPCGTTALRFRFAGWELVQAALASDPPGDEVGAMGPHALHADDAPALLDQRHVWRSPGHGDDAPPTLHRSLGPRRGVHVVDVDCIVAGPDGASAKRQPHALSPAAPTRVADQHAVLHGWQRVAAVTQRLPLRVSVREPARDAGYNHIVWTQEGLLDPFSLQLIDHASGAVLLERRAVGPSFACLDPLQRAAATRGVIGTSCVSTVPSWAQNVIHDPEDRRDLFDPQRQHLVRQRRARGLALAALTLLPEPYPQHVVQAVACAARAASTGSMASAGAVSMQRSVSHFLHTLHGESHPSWQDSVLPLQMTLERRLYDEGDGGDGVVAFTASDKHRWLVSFSTGVHDTDAMMRFVYGEVIIPVDVVSTGRLIKIPRTWTMSALVDLSMLISSSSILLSPDLCNLLSVVTGEHMTARSTRHPDILLCYSVDKARRAVTLVVELPSSQQTHLSAAAELFATVDALLSTALQPRSKLS